MRLIENPHDIQSLTTRYRAANLRIGFVPTMGFLHAGHARLIEEARMWSDVVIVSIFVNPIQFGPKEDLASYPRDLKRDTEISAKAGADLVFNPSVTGMFPFGFQTKVSVTEVSQGLCGERRPGHFEGVATVVLKFFNLVQPTTAFFGEKDYQQLLVIKRMVADLSLPIAIVGVPTVREPEGLAMSSRNAYLDMQQRGEALVLQRALQAVKAAYEAGERSTAALEASGAAVIARVPSARLDYLEVRDAQTLAHPAQVDAPSRVLGAAFLGKTRLIDNLAL